jgi:hypothetical protein
MRGGSGMVKKLGVKVKSTFDFYKILPKVKRRFDPFAWAGFSGSGFWVQGSGFKVQSSSFNG